MVARLCENSRRLRAECPANRVDGIATHVQKTTAGHVRLQTNVLSIERQWKRERRGDAAHLADAAVEKEALDLSGARMVRPHEAIHQRDLLRLAERDQCFRFGGS